MILKICILLFGSIIMMSCENSKTLSGNHKGLESVSLQLESDNISKNLTIYPTEYRVSVNGEKFEYELEKEKWDSLQNIINGIEYRKISEFEIVKPEGRFVDRNLKYIISLNSDGNQFKSKEFYAGYPPEELQELTRFLESFLPVN